MILTYYWAKFCKKIRGSAIRNSKIHKTSKIASGSNIVNVKIDKYSYCGYNCEIVNCEIGSFCSIANNVMIGGAMHPMDWVSMSPVFYKGKGNIIKTKFSKHKRCPMKKTIIGHDVWIGQYSKIKQGVEIGTGAVIGMGSVVTKNVEPYTIVAGVPAKKIRSRFSDDLAYEIAKSRWWELNDEEIRKYSPFFNDPYEFIKEMKK